MSDSAQPAAARPDLAEDVDQDGLQWWVVIFVDHRAERGSDAIGPFNDRDRAKGYADAINNHGRVQPAVIALKDEPQMKAPDPEILVDVDALLKLNARLNHVSDNAYPRIFESDAGYSVVFGHGTVGVEYRVSVEGESMSLPARGTGRQGLRSYQLSELPTPARERVVELAEERMALEISSGPEL